MSDLFSSGPMRILGLLILFMGLITLGSIANLNFEKANHVAMSPATISVSGVGEVVAVPDIGRFTFSVTAQGEDAATAQKLSGTAINDIMAYLREAGVEEKDIKTSGYNQYEKYRWEERICPVGSFCPQGDRVSDGFEVNQSVEVKVRNTDEAGALIAGVGERGATNISGLNFAIDDIEAVRSEARALAITDAKEKADELAQQLGVRIVRIVNYYEGGNSGGDFYQESRAMSMDAAGGEFTAPEISVGEQETTAQVTIVFEVK